MKTSIVPAQITTVEDRVAGNLTLSQLLLLTAPIFTGGLIYALLPPNFGGALYKVVLIVVAAILCGLMAIRVKGKILLLWVIIIARYNLRSRFHVFNKNDAYLRAVDEDIQVEALDEQVDEKLPSKPLFRLETADLVTLENIISHPDAKFHIRTNRKGALSVYITEVK